jgi:hypothetical protein
LLQQFSLRHLGPKDKVLAMAIRIHKRVKADGVEPKLKAIANPSIMEFREDNLDPFVFELNGVLIVGATMR